MLRCLLWQTKNQGNLICRTMRYLRNLPALKTQEAHAFLHGLRVVQPRRTWLGQTAYAVSRVELGNLKKKFLRQQGKQP